jgi:ABC-type phosphate/phosphonate transport system substrate-binding protein
MRQLVFLSLLFLSSLELCHADEVQYKGDVGSLIDGLSDMQTKDAQLALSIWGQELAVNAGMSTQIKYYQTVEEIIKAYENSEFAFVSLNSYFFLKYKNIFYDNTQQFWTSQKTDELFEEYVILVKEDSKIKSMKDLKHKVLVSAADDKMGRLILDYEILKEMHLSSAEYISSMKETKKHSTAILNTYFGKADACITPSYVLDLVNEMNPDVGRKLKVIYKSERIFLPHLINSHKNASEEVMRRFSVSASALDKSVRGRNVLDLFKIKKMSLVSRQDLEPMFAYYDAYIALKQKHETKRD